MSKRPWYKRFPADFINGTMALSLEEKGAYSMVLDLIYDRGSPIPDDPQWIARICGCSTRKWKIIRGRLIGFGKIAANDGLLSNGRANSQLKIERKEHENLANAAEKSHEKKPKPKQVNDLAEKGHSDRLQQSIFQKPEETSSSVSTTAASNDAADDVKKASMAVEIGRKVTDLMGVTDDPRWLGNWSQVQAWLGEGFSPDLDILPTVSSIVQKLRTGSRAMPNTLNYFTRAIRENNQIRRGSGVSPVSQNASREFVEVKANTPAFRAWIAAWKKQGRKTTWLERQRSITVPTEFPQTEIAA